LKQVDFFITTSIDNKNINCYFCQLFLTKTQKQMKNFFTLLVLCTLFTLAGYGQKKTYWTSGLEIPFSEATIEDSQNPDAKSTLRFAPIINLQSMINADMTQHVGLFSGIAVRNVGYIYDDYSTVLPEGVTTPIKKKFRTFNIGIPVGIKLGNLDGLFFYGGYEIEFPFAYKEKTFNTADEKQNTDVYWFSDRTKNLQQSWLVGIQFPYGLNLKFKYYFTEFHNEDFEANGVKPYAGLHTNIWYFSLTANLFKNFDFDPTQK
jgi:predicted small lipoprotein YifL